MARSLFGTDGVRGEANAHPMTADIAMRLGQAAGRHFRRGGRRRHAVVIGKDTRLSGYMLEPALTAGLVSVGMDVFLLGPVPTPAVGMLTRSLRADAGVMISASHNPYQDNGIKLFGPDGFKLSDAEEEAIEALMEGARLADPSELGRVRRVDDGRGRYMEAAKAVFPRHLSLSGLRIVVDCAHGAAYATAPTVLWELGAEVISLGVDPDGVNINAGVGSTAPDACRRKVIETRADLGVALDGDADRLIVVDERGEVVDGDQIMALIAGTWAKKGLLKGGALVATVMSNLGLERHLEGLGVELRRTRVGDRYVVEEMREGGFNLGGEQSGHIVMSDHATTGDGLLAALQVLAALVEENRPASEVLARFAPLPQILKNVRVKGDAAAVLAQESVTAAIAAGEARLAGTGRVLIRKSGTEPLIRVMAEGEDAALVEDVVDGICDAVRAAG